MPRPVVILSLPRCGSTTLYQLFKACGHPLVNEPFNPNIRESYSLPAPQSTGELQRAVAGLISRHGGFKHVWNRTGWPFASMELQSELLQAEGFGVILLCRRNILQRVVSEQISAQLYLWHPLNPEEQARFISHAYQPLELEEISWYLTHEHSLLAETRHGLQRSGKPWIEVGFEDLYGADRSIEARLKLFGRICSFAGLTPRREELLRQLLSAERRINSEQTYRLIPGIESVNLLFGSAETGWLFEPGT